MTQFPLDESLCSEEYNDRWQAAGRDGRDRFAGKLPFELERRPLWPPFFGTFAWWSNGL